MTNTSDALADHDTYWPYVNDLSFYRNIFKSNTLIADAIGISALAADIREGIWDKFDEAESNNGVLDLTNPADMPPNQHAPRTNGAQSARVVLTRPEALASFTAKIAHAFWLEKQKLYPWSILGYSLEECRCLFDPLYLYFTWDIEGTGGTNYAEFQSVCDHSPKRAYDHTAALLTAPRNRKAAILQLILHGADFVHSNTGTTNTGWAPNKQAEWALTMEQVTQPGTANVGNHALAGSSAFISRSGCHFMGHYQPALSRAVNIPCVDFHGITSPASGDPDRSKPGVPYAVGTGTHHSCWWPGVNGVTRQNWTTTPDPGGAKGLVLIHGDDTYPMGTLGGGGTDEGKVARRITNESWMAQHSNGKTWQERSVASQRTQGAWFIGHAQDWSNPSLYTDQGWSHVAFPICSHTKAADLSEAADLRRNFDGVLGLVPAYDYAKMVWPVDGQTVDRREQTLTIGGALTLPTGLQDNDLIVFAFAGKNTVSVTNVMPAGFAHVTGSPLTSCGDTVLIVGYKVAASEGASITYGSTTPGTEHSTAMVMAFRNVDSTTPIGEVATLCEVGTATGYIDAPLISPTDEEEFFQLIIGGKAHADLGSVFSSGGGGGGRTGAPYVPWHVDYSFFEGPNVDASLVAAYGTRGPDEKVTATTLYMNGARTANAPYFSIQLRQTAE